MKPKPASHRKCQLVGVRSMRSLAICFYGEMAMNLSSINAQPYLIQ